MIIRSKEDWLVLFKKHEASGLSAAQFCRDEKLCTRYFSKRKSQLGFSTKTAVVKVSKPKKIKVVKTSNDFIKVSVSKPQVSFNLECGDLKLCWSELPPTHWLGELIKALQIGRAHV